MSESKKYGLGDETYIAAGGELGIQRLVNRYYNLMEQNKTYHTIWSWHPGNNRTSRENLAYFLAGWTGGPALYSKTYEPINIPKAHAHLPVTSDEVKQWLSCMHEALVSLDYPNDFIEYLMRQLRIPAERIRMMSENYKQ